MMSVMGDCSDEHKSDKNDWSNKHDKSNKNEGVAIVTRVIRLTEVMRTRMMVMTGAAKITEVTMTRVTVVTRQE